MAKEMPTPPGALALWMVRCQTCNFILGSRQLPYETLMQSGMAPMTAMESLDIRRFCCRMRALGPPKYAAGYDVHTMTPQSPDEIGHRLQPLQPGMNVETFYRKSGEQVQVQKPVSAVIPEFDAV